MTWVGLQDGCGLVGMKSGGLRRLLWFAGCSSWFKSGGAVWGPGKVCERQNHTDSPVHTLLNFVQGQSGQRGLMRLGKGMGGRQGGSKQKPRS